MKSKQLKSRLTFGRLFLLFLITGLLLGLGVSQAVPEEAADCSIELADVPLELKSRAAPGLITLVLDNTRNMYYTIMTSEGDGKYMVGSQTYEILFPEHTFAGATVLPYQYRSHWKTQWSGFNTMYYNPNVTYIPWPRWNNLGVAGSPASEQADPNNPRKHPFDDKETLNLNETFYLVGEDTDDNDIIIDDADIIFSDQWATRLIDESNPLVTIGESSHYTSESTASVSWIANNLDKKKKYDVYVHIPHYKNPDSIHDGKTAKYTIMGKNSTTVQRYQPDYPGWTLLEDNIQPTTVGAITVKIEVADSSETGFIDADAVGFVCTGTVFEANEDPVGLVNIIFSHYYIKNNNGKYLINMNGALTYYKFNDINNNDIVEKDELSEISLEDAVAAEIVTHRTYDQERQNFANWYQFYRKRVFTGIGAVGQFIDDLSGVYFRLYGFPPAGFKFKLEPIRVTVDGKYYDETDTVLKNLYDLKSPQAVSNQSLRTALYDTGELIETGKSNGTGKASDMASLSSDETYPFFTEAYGGHCQQSFAILMTGGYWTLQGENINVGDFDEDGSSNTLADVAMYFYDRDLRENLANEVPTNYMDLADRQHLVVYGISFGVEGTLDPKAYPDCALGGPCPSQWPPPQTEHPTTIDDLWHATVNGRGLFINAANPEELVRALKAIRSDIEIRLGSAAAVSTNSVQRQTGTHLYQGTYHSGFWAGDLLAKPIDVKTGAVLPAIWSAQQELEKKDWGDRNIFTSDGSSGIVFNYNSLSDKQKEQLGSENVVDYLRGNRSLELKNGGPFRNRDCKLGDIVHSEPVYHQGVVYTGANDGMLHAFDADSGEELFAYVPNLVFDHLIELTRLTYEHKYYVNNTPYAKIISGGTSLLVGGLSKGGKGYFCLDITNPKSFITDNVMWEYSAELKNDDDLGYSYSRAYIVNTKAEGWVVVFGNGYNSVNGEAVLYVLDATTGNLIKKIHTEAFGCNGIIANLSIIDPNFDGYADYVYAGDLKGNMWKFDISGASKNDWGTSFMAGSVPKPLFTAKNEEGQVQPITTAADVMHHCTLGNLGYLVIFGTGQYVNEADFDTTDIQTLYGITDWQPAWQYLEYDPKDKYLGEFTADRLLSNLTFNLSSNDDPLLKGLKTITLLQQSGSFISNEDTLYFVMNSNDINYWNMTVSGDHLGWYFDLPQPGERVIRDPIIRNGVVVSIGSTPVQTPCSSGGISVLYQLNACTGGTTVTPQFDIDRSKKVDSDDVIKKAEGEICIPSGIMINSMLYKPVDIKDRLYISDDSANINEIVVPSALGGMLYWRETDLRP
jgi:type IV pilus assembly protein PilY1